jgi:diguanylate cyclase (GGDEF)-like protein/PAS domain S-box-containing protein
VPAFAHSHRGGRLLHLAVVLAVIAFVAVATTGAMVYAREQARHRAERVADRAALELRHALDRALGEVGAYRAAVDAGPAGTAAARIAAEARRLGARGVLPAPPRWTPGASGPAQPAAALGAAPPGASAPALVLGAGTASPAGVLRARLGAEELLARVRSALPGDVRPVLLAPGADPPPGVVTAHPGATASLPVRVGVVADEGMWWVLPGEIALAGLALLGVVVLTVGRVRAGERRQHRALAQQSRVRERALRDLRDREARFRSLATEVPVGIVLVGPDGLVEFANDRAGDLLCAPGETLVGAPLPPGAVDAADAAGIRAAMAHAAVTGAPAEGECRVERPGGSRHLQVRVVPAGEGWGGGHRLIATVVDISEQRAREDRERSVRRVAGAVAAGAAPEKVEDMAREASARLLGPRGARTDADRDLAEHLAQLVELARARAATDAALTARAESDPLTGLPNRRTFDERLAAETARAARLGRPLSLAVVDLDHFKRVNDLHGHPAGDGALVELGLRLRAAAREDDLVARVGGEEFAWIMPGCTGADALAVADRLRSAVAGEPFSDVGRLTCSVGVCDLACAGDAETLYRLADAALYEAKAGGRDAAVLHGDGHGTRLLHPALA